MDQLFENIELEGESTLSTLNVVKTFVNWISVILVLYVNGSKNIYSSV
jgi:hypothetical protein